MGSKKISGVVYSSIESGEELMLTGESPRGLKSAAASSTFQEELRSTDKTSSSGELMAQHDKLAVLVSEMCVKKQFKAVIQGCKLLPVLPTAPILHFVSFLQAFVLRKLPDVNAEMEKFTSALQSFSSGGSVVAGSSASGASISSLEETKENEEKVMVSIFKTVRVGADAVMGNLNSWYERKQIAGMLWKAESVPTVQRLDITGWYGFIYMVYDLLGEEGENFIHWTTTDNSRFHYSSIDAKGVSNALLSCSRWGDARKWAEAVGIDVHVVTEAQAEAMLRDWRELRLWDEGPEFRLTMWKELHDLWVAFQLPPDRVASFYVKIVEDCQNQLTPPEWCQLLFEALRWAMGEFNSKSEKKAVFSEATIDALKNLLSLKVVEASETGHIDAFDFQGLVAKNKQSSSDLSDFTNIVQAMNVGESQSVQDELWQHQGGSVEVGSEASFPATELTVYEIQHLGGSGSGDLQSTGSHPRSPLTPQPPKRDQIEFKIQESIRKLAGFPARRLVDRAVRNLLEHGQVAAARKLQASHDLQTPPLELHLVESSLNILRDCSPLTGQGKPVRQVLSATIFEYLKKKNEGLQGLHPDPEQVLEALETACRPGSGKSVCRKAVLVFKASAALQLPPLECIDLGPVSVLELLLNNPNQGLKLVEEYAGVHNLSSNAIAQKVARAVVRGLCNVEEETPDLEYSPLLKCVSVVGDRTLLGNALLHCLTEPAMGLPAEQEAQIIILAHQYYREASCFHGVDALLQIVNFKIRQYTQENEFKALQVLVGGLGRYYQSQIIPAVEALVGNDKTNMLLDVTTIDPAQLRAMILGALQRQKPLDQDAYNMVYNHFEMNSNIAANLEAQAQVEISSALNMRKSQTIAAKQSPALLKAMELLIAAAHRYKRGHLGRAAFECASRASMIALQIRQPDQRWINLDKADYAEKVFELKTFYDALVVASANELNTPDDWTYALWKLMISLGEQTNNPQLAIQIWETYVKDMQDCMIITKDQLEEIGARFQVVVDRQQQSQQIRQQGVKKGKINLDLLFSFFKILLESIGDFQEKLDILETMDYEQFDDIKAECVRILDIQKN